MSILKNKRRKSPTDYEEYFQRFYNSITQYMSKTSRRKRIWVCNDLGIIINKLNKLLTTLANNESKWSFDMKQSAASQALKHFDELQEKLLIFWLVNDTKESVTMQMADLLNESIDSLNNRFFHNNHADIRYITFLDKDKINNALFLSTMKDFYLEILHRIIRAKNKYNFQQLSLIKICIDDAFVKLYLGNSIYPVTDEVEAYYRLTLLTEGIDSLKCLDQSLLFLFNVCHYSDEIRTNIVNKREIIVDYTSDIISHNKIEYKKKGLLT